jgi:GH24 family phage-related lysozyme (muramidase)
MPHQTPSPLLAFLRLLLGQSRTPDTRLPAAAVATPNEAPDFLFLDSVSCVSNTPPTRSIGPAGIALIKRFEGCARLRADGMIEAYPDPGTGGAPWTIGWGATGRDSFGGGMIGPETCWTQAQCDARLEQDLKRFAAEVAAAIGTAPTSQVQFDALVSFHYNTGAIARATLTQKHVVGDHHGAAREFARWNRAGGRVLKGLVRRRAAEADLYRQ